MGILLMCLVGLGLICLAICLCAITVGAKAEEAEMAQRTMRQNRQDSSQQ